jgi:RND family efflux transporter MFP subunit
MRTRARHLPLFVSASLAVMAAGPLYAAGPLPVEAVIASYKPSVAVLDLTGTIEASDVVPVAFKSPGRITTLHVDVGARVKQGDVLAELDPTQPNAAIGAASAQFSAATAQLTQAQSVYDRLSGLVTRGATTRASLDNAEQELMAARASQDEAEAQLAKARQALTDSKLRAPVDGIVTARSAEQGQVAGAGQTLLTIAHDGIREAQFYVPAMSQLDDEIGTTIEIMPLEQGGEGFPAKISEIAPLVNSSTGTISLRARIDAAPETFGLGTPIKSRVEISSEPSILLPAASLVTHDGNSAVWVIDKESNRVAIRNVEIARFNSETIEVRTGLQEGELVAGAGAYLLFPNREVAPQEVSR